MMTGTRRNPAADAARDPEGEHRWLGSPNTTPAGRASPTTPNDDSAKARPPTATDGWNLASCALIDELAEEAADLGAWGVLALQALHHDLALSSDDREWISRRLSAAILWGAYAHLELSRARAGLESPGKAGT
jgi:hypothetical protein